MGKVESKLVREFNVESVLGSGAFGMVLKAKNKFDDSSYAIKLIQQSNAQDQEKSTKEVQVFSKLSSHENVVAYKAAWIDRLERSALQEIIIDLSIDLDMLKRLRFNIPLTSINIMCIQMELCGQVFSKLSSHQNVVAYKAGWVDRLERSALQGIINDLSIDPEMLKRLKFINPLTSINIMCIQMELCGQDMRSWLRKRAIDKKDVNERKYWKIFGQILKGLRHIHSHKILHRDLKPDNIFITGNSNSEAVKIGDLGLAKAVPDDIYVDALHSATGTICYMPPEQFKGLYNKAVDIYPLGIILTELFAIDQQSELVMLILSLRMGQIPENITEKWPEVAVLISRMLKNDPEERIRLNEILNVHKEIKREFSRDTHNTVTCDGCKKRPIRGIRFKCKNCDDFDLCENCKENVEHDPTHSFEELSEVDTKKRNGRAVLNLLAGMLSSKLRRASTAAGEIGDTVNSNSNTSSTSTTTTQGVNCWKCKETGLSGVVHKCTECTRAYYCPDCFKASALHVKMHKFETINLDEVQVESAESEGDINENLILLEILRRVIERREREEGQ